MIGWTAVIFAIQGWLGETPAQAAAATTPSYLQVGMAAMSLGVVRTFSHPHHSHWTLRPMRLNASSRDEDYHANWLRLGLHAPFLASYYEWRVVNWPCASCRCVELCLLSQKPGLHFLKQLLFDMGWFSSSDFIQNSSVVHLLRNLKLYT